MLAPAVPAATPATAGRIYRRSSTSPRCQPVCRTTQEAASPDRTAPALRIGQAARSVMPASGAHVDQLGKRDAQHRGQADEADDVDPV